MNSKIKVLCVCAKGKNRSKYLANYLRRMGDSTRFGGIDEGGEVVEKIEREIRRKDIEWADVIIIIRKRLVKIFNKRFGKVDKRMIVLDVTDSRRLAAEQDASLADLSHTDFQRKWTRPQLRKAIKLYLPLKKK